LTWTWNVSNKPHSTIRSRMGTAVPVGHSLTYQCQSVDKWDTQNWLAETGNSVTFTLTGRWRISLKSPPWGGVIFSTTVGIHRRAQKCVCDVRVYFLCWMHISWYVGIPALDAGVVRVSYFIGTGARQKIRRWINIQKKTRRHSNEMRSDLKKYMNE
jgi:hypothetical protein